MGKRAYSGSIEADHRRQRGASAVELALLAPFLILLLFGVIESSWFLARSLDVAQAAREAGRMAGVNDGNEAAILLSVCNGMDEPAGAEITLTGAGSGLGGEVTATAEQDVDSITGLLDPLLTADSPLPHHDLPTGANNCFMDRYDWSLLMNRRLISDRGATAVIVAVCLLLLCGMAALAVDLGLGFRERRFDQGGADAAALGGSLEMVITNQANPVRAAIANVHTLVEANLGGRVVPQADWAACTDPGALYWQTKSDGAMLGTTDIGSDCISMSENFNTFRVRVPLQGVDTTFGAALGFTEIDVSAAAEAERNTDWGGGGDFPSGVLSSAQVGDMLCLKTGPAGQQATCAPASTGDFGTYQPYFYSAVAGDLATICVSGEQKAPLARSMADGIDHEFSGHNNSMVSPNNRINGLWCQQSGVPGPPFPNMVNSGAGSTSDDATWGLVTGETWPAGSGYDGRLERSYADGSATIYGNKIDNRPLWTYIDPAVTIPSCQAAALFGATVTPAQYPAAIAQTITCITDANATPATAVFTADILTTNRLVHSPLFWETAKRSNNSCCYHIKGIVPVFLDGVWADSSHNTFNCNGFIDDTALDICVHRPGLVGSMTVNPAGQKKIMSASGILLSCGILPAGTCSPIQDGTNPLNFLYDLQLTR